MNWFRCRAVGPVLLGLILQAGPSAAASLPPGFAESLVATGMINPTAMAFAPDGRIFVCQQNGRLRVIKNGALLGADFVTVTTDSSSERGLLGVAFDPAFATNQWVYVYYTVPARTTPPTAPPHNRVSRFTAQGDVAATGSETIILELDNLSAGNHNGGAIHFGPDGKLYIATGENAVMPNAQTLANLLGKILRINADGTIPTDNPFFATASGKNRAIWALGLRNPFTFGFHATSGRMFVNDVGAGTAEEINDGIVGSNYGWPMYEGSDNGDPGFRDPLFQYPHGNGTSAGCAIVGAAFYDATTKTFPADYADAYFFGDLCNGWIRRYDPVLGTVNVFATNIPSLVDLNVRPDGSLYYLARSSELFRVTYQAISISDTSVVEGASGTTTATFTVSLSGARNQTVTVAWTTGDSTATSPSDYAAASGTVSFAPGETSKTVMVAVNGDVVDEADEVFFVTLSNASGAAIADDQGRGTIIDDDQAAVSVSDASVVEGASGTNAATFLVSLSTPSAFTVTVRYSTANGTATAGSDYTAATGTVTFVPGQVSRPITVTIAGDTVVEGNETFFVNLGVPTNAIVADGQGVGTIINDDPFTEAGRADFLMLGQVRGTTVPLATSTQWFKVRLVAGRSYAASAWAPATDPSESPVSLGLTWFMDDGVTGAAGASAAATEPVPVAGGHLGAAMSIIPSSAQCFADTGCTYRLRLQATGAAALYAVKLLVVETTLVSPYWQVATAFGYDAAPQVRNNTSSPLSVTFTAHGSGGGTVCSNTFTVPANGMTTFGISGVAPGCSIASGFGSAQLAHHGPPGSITANITTFSASSGLSFDAPFRPRNTWTSLRTH